uniref:ATP synthase subunit a n=1 Tax=Allobates insperatus TaxID=248976 RepID=A0A7M3UT23_9NEOB|nr:ATP synthase F0 subunit 6 [Allobates insperatus]
MTLNLFTQFAPPYLLGITLFAFITALPWTLFLTPPWPWWLPGSRWSFVCSNVVKDFLKQIFSPMNVLGQKWALIFTSLMFFLLSNNLLGLLPYTFTPTTQLSMNLGLAFPFWLVTVLVAIRHELNNTLAHLLPTGTPTLLIPFLIILETISLLIRPMALGVRLTANLTAGHLLIQLISMATIYVYTHSAAYSLLIFVPLLLLTILEMAVAIIQAYVFVMLLSFYIQENLSPPPA